MEESPSSPVVIRLDQLPTAVWVKLLDYLPLKQFIKLSLVSKRIRNVQIPKQEAKKKADEIVLLCSRDADNFDWWLVIDLSWKMCEVSIGRMSQTGFTFGQLFVCSIHLWLLPW